MLVIDVNDIRKFNITYPYPGMPIYAAARGIANIEVEMATGTIDRIKKSLQKRKCARIPEYVASRPNDCNRPEIENVIFNPPATIVKWSDGTKTVVKCQEGDEFDPEIGLSMAISRKYFGSRNKMLKIVEKEYWENPRFFRAKSDERVENGTANFRFGSHELFESLKRVADELSKSNETGGSK